MVGTRCTKGLAQRCTCRLEGEKIDDHAEERTVPDFVAELPRPSERTVHRPKEPPLIPLGLTPLMQSLLPDEPFTENIRRKLVNLFTNLCVKLTPPHESCLKWL